MKSKCLDATLHTRVLNLNLRIMRVLKDTFSPGAFIKHVQRQQVYYI